MTCRRPRVCGRSRHRRSVVAVTGPADRGRRPVAVGLEVVDTLSIRAARRLALARAGLSTPEQTGLPRRARGRGTVGLRRRGDGHRPLRLPPARHGVGGRAPAATPSSCCRGSKDSTPPSARSCSGRARPLFEYWGHEASWIPLSLYPAFEFRRREFRHHPWWGDLVGENPKVAAELRRRIREDGPLRSAEMEGRGSKGWWDLGVMKRVASALWSSGELAIRERRNFQRTYDLAERVIPEDAAPPSAVRPRTGWRRCCSPALDGHGWATTGTLAATWRLRNRKAELVATLRRLQEKGAVLACALEARDGSPTPGWIRPARPRAGGAARARAAACGHAACCSRRSIRSLWDRARVARLFGFDALLEIFKPAPQRLYGYYCLPVLAGEHLVARVDLKADRRRGALRVVSAHFENAGAAVAKRDRQAARIAVDRYADALGLKAAW